MLTCMSRKEMNDLTLKYKQQTSEVQLLQFYGSVKFKQITLLSLDLRLDYDYQIKDIMVNWKGRIYKIHTFVGSNISNNDITFVLFHGWGGSNVQYCPIYKQLIQQVNVISIDLPGMALSSKDDISISDYQNTVEFFVSTLELWRQEMKLDKFYLIGHSFGGYIATQYAISYPQYIQQLFLLSPAGTSQLTKQEIKQIQDFSQQSFPMKMLWGFLRDMWENQTTPYKISQNWLSDIFVDGYLTKKLKLQGKELECWKQYMKDIIKLPDGSEKALFTLFQFPKTIPNFSIEQLIEESRIFQQFPISFYYGDKDWMDKTGALRLSEKYFDRINCRLQPQSGHQLHFDNPKYLLEFIFQDFSIHNPNKAIEWIISKNLEEKVD